MKYIKLLALLCSVPNLTAQNISCEEMKALMQADAEIWNSGDLDRLAEIYHPECNDPKLYTGLAERRAYGEKILAENKNFQTRIDQMACDGDKLWVSYTCSGYSTTYQAEFEAHGFNVAQVKDGKLWKFVDGGLNILPGLMKAGYTLERKSTNARALFKQSEIVYNTGNLDLLDQIYTQDYVDGDPAQPNYTSIAKLKEETQRTIDENENLKLTYGEPVVEGNRYMVDWTAIGHSTVFGVPFSVKGYSQGTFRDGKIAQNSTLMDLYGALAAEGYTLAPAKTDRARLEEIARIDEEIWATGNLDRLSEIYADDVVDFGLTTKQGEGLGHMKQGRENVLATNDNFKMKYQQIVYTDDGFMGMYRSTGYSKEYEIEYALNGVAYNVVRDGKIVKTYGYYDALTPLVKAGYKVVRAGN